MAKNAEKIIKRYGDGSREENRNSGERADYIMEYKYTKKLLDNYISPDSNVLEVGCGTGYYGMYLHNKCRKYTGVDISPGNINLLSKKVHDNSIDNVDAFVGDATNLTECNDSIYDVVLVLGPMYHLPQDERMLVFAECKRVCKAGGIIMFAYINKVGVYLSGCLYEADKYPNKQKNKSLLVEGIDDTRDSIYWFTMPEEMENDACKHGLTVLENLGVDFIFIPEMFNQSSEKKEAWTELVDFLCSSKSCTGFSNHAVLICKNQ